VNPDKLRMEAASVQFVHDFVQSGNLSPRSVTARGTSSRPMSRAAAG
jgi:hypothetical protein